jgi:hypothetical protein
MYDGFRPSGRCVGSWPPGLIGQALASPLACLINMTVSAIHQEGA